jgi:hypothetical protein
MVPCNGIGPEPSGAGSAEVREQVTPEHRTYASVEQVTKEQDEVRLLPVIISERWRMLLFRMMLPR